MCVCVCARVGVGAYMRETAPGVNILLAMMQVRDSEALEQERTHAVLEMLIAVRLSLRFSLWR